MAKLFISYNHADSEIASQVSSALKKAGILHWVDFNDIIPGQNFVRRMSDGLGAADYVVLLYSTNSATSNFVNMEWNAAIAMGTIVIPLRLDNTELPPLLAGIIYIDLRTNKESGIQKLVDFFAEEVSSVSPTRLSEDVSLPKLTKRELRIAAQNCLDTQDFLSILFEFDYREEEVPGSSLAEKITRLMLTLRRDGHEEDLVDWMLTERRLNRCLFRVLKSSQS